MSILEGLGPKRKVFEDLEPGDYLFEVAEPGDKGWLFEIVDEENPKAILRGINWRLRVVQPEEFAGKPFFHSTWISATPEKIAMAKKPWDPSAFTYQFFAGIGAAIMENGESIVLNEFLTPDGDPDLNKMIGLRFQASVRKGVNKKQPDRVGIADVWPED